MPRDIAVVGGSFLTVGDTPQRPTSSLPFSATYPLERSHKHIREMMKYSDLKTEPHTNFGLLTEVERVSCGAF